MKVRVAALVPVMFLSSIACHPQEGLTREEAAQAADELQLGTASQSLTASTVELTTNFTIGGAVQQAAEELRGFIQSQLACAEVTLADHTLTVQYGAKGTCLYRGNVISGTHEVTVTRNEDTDVVVDHVWTDLSNGKVTVSGTAEVTWSRADVTRHVVHELTWTRLADGRTGTGRGDRLQRPLPEGLDVGFSEDGTRSWDGARGHWSLDIDHLELRWVDPLPQSGSLTLETPFDKTVVASFSRPTATSIRMTLEGPRGSLSVNVVTPP